MDTSELHTDGNGVAGMMQQIFAAEITTARRRCDGCGEDHAIGEHMAYSGAGMVLRCPNCGDLAATFVPRNGEYVVGMHGTWRLSAPDE